MLALYELENQKIFDQKANSKTCFLRLTLCQKQLNLQVDTLKKLQFSSEAFWLDFPDFL